ncbi:unnamed protein product [Calicophoron daubneyi]|uniref:Ribosomal RNA-processing protein 42 n=1 Tax=Calicophoron daubneyi TaxID=300641 RepID=A0AAV2TED5_CALDB
MADINLLKPVTVFEQLFERTVCLDGRDPLCHAPLRVSAHVLPSCSGSSFVKIGHTEVICGVKVKVLPENVNGGRVVCNVELNDLASRNVHPAFSTSIRAQTLSSVLQRIIDTIACPDLASQLNIYTDAKEPVASYLLKLDVIVVVDDGCLLDACLPAALVALSCARWPKLIASSPCHYNTTLSESYRPSACNEFISVKLSEWPLSLSFCVLAPHLRNPDSCPLIVQPSKRESTLWDTDACELRVTLNANKRFFDMYMVNSVLSNLTGYICPSHSQGDAKSSLWEAVFRASTTFSAHMKDAINSCLEVSV